MVDNYDRVEMHLFLYLMSIALLNNSRSPPQERGSFLVDDLLGCQWDFFDNENLVVRSADAKKVEGGYLCSWDNQTASWSARDAWAYKTVYNVVAKRQHEWLGLRNEDLLVIFL